MDIESLLAGGSTVLWASLLFAKTSFSTAALVEHCQLEKSVSVVGEVVVALSRQLSPTTDLEYLRGGKISKSITFSTCCVLGFSSPTLKLE
jgi:hypothetical protein